MHTANNQVSLDTTDAQTDLFLWFFVGFVMHLLILFYILFLTDRQTFERTPNALKCQWLIQNLSYNSAIVVSISYWSFIVVMDHSSKYSLARCMRRSRKFSQRGPNFDNVFI